MVGEVPVMLMVFPKVHIVKVQTDNGSEFLGRFHDYLEKSHIPHDFTYLHSPKINGVVTTLCSSLLATRTAARNSE